MKTLKKITFALFFVAIGTAAFAQTSTPVLMPNGKVVLIEEKKDHYDTRINDDEDDEDERTISAATTKESCKSCYVGLRTEGDQSVNGVKRVQFYDPRQQ
jgi:hypothetical protein